MVVGFRAGECGHGGRGLRGTGHITAPSQPISYLENPSDFKRKHVSKHCDLQ